MQDGDNFTRLTCPAELSPSSLHFSSPLVGKWQVSPMRGYFSVSHPMNPQRRIRSHDCLFLDQRESAGRGAINTSVMIERRKELAAWRQFNQVDESLYQWNIRTEYYLVDNELVRRPSRVSGSRLFKKVTSYALRLLLH